MTGRISSYQAERWLADFQQSWVAMHYDDPEVAGAYASEVFGGGYARAQAIFTTPSSRAIWNVDPITFAGFPSVTITHLGLWDQEIGGNYMASIALDVPVRLLAGKQVVYAPNAIAVSLD